MAAFAEAQPLRASDRRPAIPHSRTGPEGRCDAQGDLPVARGRGTAQQPLHDPPAPADTLGCALACLAEERNRSRTGARVCAPPPSSSRYFAGQRRGFAAADLPLLASGNSGRPAPLGFARPASGVDYARAALPAVAPF